MSPPPPVLRCGASAGYSRSSDKPGKRFLLTIGLDAGIDSLRRCEEVKSVVHVDGPTVIHHGIDAAAV
jgi:hypothetical protein